MDLTGKKEITLYPEYSTNPNLYTFKKCKCVFTNRFYQHHFIRSHRPLITSLEQFKENKVTINGTSIDAISLILCCRRRGIKLSKTANLLCNYILIFFLCFKFIFALIATYFWNVIKVVFLISFKDESLKSTQVGIINCTSSIRKIRQYLGGRNEIECLLYDDLRINLNSTTENSMTVGLFQILPKRERISLLLSLISFKNLLSIVSEIREFNGVSFIDFSFLDYYSKRCFTSRLCELALISLFKKNNQITQVISGSTNEWYAISLKNVCSTFKIKSICIPHGVSPGIELPHGVFGDIYYCLSLVEKRGLDSTYRKKQQQFVFDEKFIKNTMVVSSPHIKFSNNIVVFTDSRCTSLDQHLIDLVSKEVSFFYIKLHPNDVSSNYIFPENTSLIQDFPFAISQSICISRVSAILLDAINNDSVAISYQNSKDDRLDAKFLFPGMFDEKVSIVFSPEHLRSTLKGFI